MVEVEFGDFNPFWSSEELERLSARMSRSAPNLTEANMRRGFLSGMNLTAARLSKSNLSEANLEGADLPGAQLQDANLFGAQLQDADLGRAQLQDANLRRAQLQDANLRRAQLQGSMWHYAILTGTAEQPNVPFSTNLSASTNNGGALRFVDLSRAVRSQDRLAQRVSGRVGHGAVLQAHRRAGNALPMGGRHHRGRSGLHGAVALVVCSS